MFFKGSRYENVADLDYQDPVTKRIIAYKAVRAITTPSASVGHIVRGADRLDLIAFSYYQDALRFWRICDANLALWPPDLVSRPGSILRVPESAG